MRHLRTPLWEDYEHFVAKTWAHIYTGKHMWEGYGQACVGGAGIGVCCRGMGRHLWLRHGHGGHVWEGNEWGSDMCGRKIYQGQGIHCLTTNLG